MKKNIIASALQSIGTIIVCIAIRFEIKASWYVWWVNLIIELVLFIGFLMINFGIDKVFENKISAS